MSRRHGGRSRRGGGRRSGGGRPRGRRGGRGFLGGLGRRLGLGILGGRRRRRRRSFLSQDYVWAYNKRTRMDVRVHVSRAIYNPFLHRWEVRDGDLYLSGGYSRYDDGMDMKGNTRKITINIDAYATDWLSEPYKSDDNDAEGKKIDYGPFNPHTALNDLVPWYGEPDLFDPKSGGMAVWLPRSLSGKGRKSRMKMKSAMSILQRIEIRDEQLRHTKPGPHVDYLYFEVKMTIPRKTYTKLHLISDSISYDPLEDAMIVTVRCHFQGANWATLTIIIDVLEGNLQLDDPTIEATYASQKVYKERIMATAHWTKDDDGTIYDPKRMDQYIERRSRCLEMGGTGDMMLWRWQERENMGTDIRTKKCLSEGTL